jgi:hypothetical protein
MNSSEKYKDSATASDTEASPETHWIGEWVSPRAVLDDMEK